MLPLSLRLFSLNKKWYRLLLFFSAVGIFCFIRRFSLTDSSSRGFRPVPHYLRTHVPQRINESQSHTRSMHPLALIVLGSDVQQSEDAKRITYIVKSLRLTTYSVRPLALFSQIHELIHTQTFQLLVFEDFLVYFSLPARAKRELDEYCKKHNVGVVGFFKNVETLKEIPGSADFIEMDPSYPLLLRRFPASSSPKGFYLSHESEVLRVARAGQMDYRPLSDQVPPCRDWQHTSPWCFVQRRDPYPQLLADASSVVQHFTHLLPGFDSVIRRGEETVHEHKKPWKGSWATFVPLSPMDANYFQTVAFTQTPVKQGIELEWRSCAFRNGTGQLSKNENSEVYQSLVIEDIGRIDGIKRILFAFPPLQHWSTSLLLSDATHYLLKPSAILEYDLGLLRYIHVDIDDVFVARQGSRMTPTDVKALLETQKRWRHIIPGFTFYLGFSGQWFLHGSPEEQRGDEDLIRYRHHFKWFCHTWSHSSAHLISEEKMLEQLRLNKVFAEQKDLPIAEGYAVAPHHSGVYPVTPHLYRAWKAIWRINVTTTEGYPHFNPPRLRRGFSYMGVQVLPRQVCSVYTGTTRFDNYQGGVKRLDGMAFGGDLFDTFLFNPVSLFMTHFGNYAQDRLAPYVFERAFTFIRGWTNLEVRWAPLARLVKYHLAFNPLENPATETSLPIHGDPCSDPRHRAIWPPAACTPESHRLPSAIIVGPQKTGSTALLAFMAMHPNLAPNRFLTRPPFEEIQFFSNSTIYTKGVAFYAEQFNLGSGNQGDRIHFEKSATYYDSLLAPKRMAALLPGAKIIVILREPVRRAYSWYQHQRAHNVSAALLFTFNEVLQAFSIELASQMVARISHPGNITRLAMELHRLHLKCVIPSVYVDRLKNWLHYYHARQIALVEAERLESTPSEVMRDLQEFLDVPTYLDYSKLLVQNPTKGYFCATGGPYPKAGQLLKPDVGVLGQWCLSAQKGRPYDLSVLDSVDSSLFKQHNQALATLILQQPFWRPRHSKSATDLIPRWINILSYD
ncbi:unnamed protein product [Mesocestoides corti]|uniref:[heparan sulfate]-glucosamine N-sulfotransferase n=2 Tax=Mesocestoides corti TaxID=53468 RepID=A0A0R3UM25_MESCO|nr:unnamed protein product [Mesocestoides corti]